MRFVLFYHSLLSDWNHGNAHFLRGIASELLGRGHSVQVFEPRDGWSLRNLRQSHGDAPLDGFRAAYPQLQSTLYDPHALDLDRELAEADVVIVHEWNDTDLVRRIGQHRAAGAGYALLFHDTHHRSVTAAEEMSAYDLDEYDGVLAFGDVVRDIYRDRGWAQRVWTWHEAADTRLFRPPPQQQSSGDLVWIGNWGDGERSEELHRFLIQPVEKLRLDARVHGVRYPESGLKALADAGIRFGGWLPNYQVPHAFAQSRMTIHIPRRPYRELLHGIPTIRVFEALACGIPLVCLRWEDSERLFSPDEDYLVAETPSQMTDALHAVHTDEPLAERLAAAGRKTILERHTCAHRVDELLDIVASLSAPRRADVLAHTSRQISPTVTGASPL